MQAGACTVQRSTPLAQTSAFGNTFLRTLSSGSMVVSHKSEMSAGQRGACKKRVCKNGRNPLRNVGSGCCEKQNPIRIPQPD